MYNITCHLIVIIYIINDCNRNQVIITIIIVIIIIEIRVTVIRIIAIII